MINGQNHSKEKEWLEKGRQDKHFKMKQRGVGKDSKC